MKKFFLLAVSFAALMSCNNGGQKSGYTIEGKIADGITNVDGRYVYLIPYGVKGEMIDSVLIEKNAFKFEGTDVKSKVCVLYFQDKNDPAEATTFSAPFVLENGKMQAMMDTFSYVTGTPENDAFKVVQEKLAVMGKEYKSLIPAIKAGDPEAENKLNQINQDALSAVKAYIDANPTKLSAAKLFYDFHYQMDTEQQEAVLAKSDSTFQSFPGISGIMSHLEVLKTVAPGKMFVDFEMSDNKGKMHKLSDYVGQGKKVVLIDFWASWCGPCMHEVPNLVETYKKYRRKGFEIVGVSLDNKEDAWLEAIKDKKMTWTHLSDLKGWKSAGAALYGVRSIPSTYLVDKDGTILARNIMGDELNKKLEEVLK